MLSEPAIADRSLLRRDVLDGASLKCTGRESDLQGASESLYIDAPVSILAYFAHR